MERQRREGRCVLSHYFIIKCGREGMDWIHLAQDSDHWRALVNKVMNFRVP
jgi:hypothetical protein